MIKLIIFDLDGTLLDTIEDIANATNSALKVFNFAEYDVESYRLFVGSGLNKLIERVVPKDQKNRDVISMVKHEFLKYYMSHADDYTKPYPGISGLLDKLQLKGYQLGVASNKMQDATVELVKRFFPDINFTSVLGQREGIPVKPAPDILHEIIDSAGVLKSETLYIGDSGVDALTAGNGAIDFIGVLWGFRPKQELIEAGANRFARSPKDILQSLNKD